MPLTITKAKVTVVLEIEVDDRWGGDCNIDQVYRQAEQSAIGMVRRWRDSMTPAAKQKVQIVGTPTVEALTSTRNQ